MHAPDFVPRHVEPLEYYSIGSVGGSTCEIARTADWLLAGMPGNDMIEGLAIIGLEGLTGLGQNVTLLPNVDIAATEKEYILTIEVPGVDEKDVKLELVGGTLTIKAEKRQESEQKEKDFYRVECVYGSFQRTLTLPDDADPENVQASFKNGVLTIRLPRKALALPKGKLIEIKTTAQ